MAAPSATVPLENHPGNPCIGCGPEHPTGLRLAFRREGDAVTTTFAASGRYQGFPGRLHSGILYLALLETANWTVYGLQGRVGIPVRTTALEAKRWVATGEALTLAGRVVPADGETVRVRIEAMDAQSAVVASLERDYDILDRATFLVRMGYKTMPPAFESDFRE
jgi:hypothetical protein